MKGPIKGPVSIRVNHCTVKRLAKSAPLVMDRVKISENLGTTEVTPVAPVITYL